VYGKNFLEIWIRSWDRNRIRKVLIPSMILKKFDLRCKAKTKSGKRCRAAATEGGLCFFHANPNKAAELGRIGGKSKRQFADETEDPLPTLNNPLAIQDTVSRLIGEIYEGKLNPKIASGLAPLLNLQLRAIETTDLERRIVKLEKKLADTPAKEEWDDNDVINQSPRRVLFRKLTGRELPVESKDDS
jgi:hypothetical protein